MRFEININWPKSTQKVPESRFWHFKARHLSGITNFAEFIGLHWP